MMMGSPLTIHHERLGARLDEGKAPVQFTDPVQEYWCLKTRSGILDLSHQGRLTITGKDRISFLNGLLSNDLTKMGNNGGVHALLLSTKARVLADLYLYNAENSQLVDTTETDVHKVKVTLDGFIITEDVQIQDSSDQLLMISLQGPRAAEALKEVMGVNTLGLQKNLSHKMLGPSLVINRDRTGLGGYDIMIPREEAEAVWNSFLLKPGNNGPAPVGLKALEILRLENGIPKYGTDVDENIIVLEAGYQDAISYTKGCYMGQEVVARATHIGRVNKRLVQLHMESAIPPGPRSKLEADGKEVGYVTSSAFSPGLNKVVGLGYIQRDFATVGTTLTVDAEHNLLSATVTKIA